MADRTKKLRFIVKDSGKRDSFVSGAVRDIQSGKGRFDLITPLVAERLAKIYEAGAVKYAARNWERGMPLGRYLDSALRHLNQYQQGYRDEDHLGHAIWNLSALLHTEEMIRRKKLDSKLADLPKYI